MTGNVRYALRRAARQRGLSLTLVAALALGLGGATAILALANRVLVNPLGLPQPERVVHIYAGPDPQTAASFARLPAFAAVAAYRTGMLAVTAGTNQGHLGVAAITAGFFGAAGVAPDRGREFSPKEMQAGDQVAIISGDLAAAGFHGYPLGHSVVLGGSRFAVIGVMPAGFGFPAGMSVWVPFRSAQRHLVLLNGPLDGELIARLRPGVGVQSADAQVKTEMRRQVAALEAAHPETKFGMSSAYTSSLVGNWSRQSRPTVLLLLAAAGLLWLVACFDFGGVLLARALGGQRDMATRRALGAPRWRLALSWLVEALVVVAPASLAAAGVAAGLMAALRRGAPNTMLGLSLLHPHWSDWGVLAALAALTVIVTAMPPALSMLRLRPPPEMLQSAFLGKTRASVLWPVLVVAELTLALTLSAGAALLLASYSGLTRTNLGLNPAGIATVSYTPAPALLTALNRERTAPPAERAVLATVLAGRAQALHSQVLAAARLAAGPGVALVENPPFSPMAAGGAYFVPALGEFDHGVGLEPNVIMGPYFRVLGLPLLRGRYFGAADAGSPVRVAILSRAAAHALWGGADPVGRHLYENGVSLTVVGEVGDIRVGGATDDGTWKGQIYLAQPPSGPALVMTAVTRGDGAALAAAVGAVNGIEVLGVSTLDRAASQVLVPERFSALVLAMFSGLALLLIALGVLALLTHWVAAQHRDIAVRLTLGAAPAAMARRVMTRLAMMLAAAVGLGLMLSPVEKSLLAHLLYGVSPLDAGLWTAAVAAVCAAALAAAAVPALRATRVAPADTLRCE